MIDVPTTRNASASAPANASTPPIDCAAWCADGQGHSDAHPEDQYCSAAYMEIELTRERPQEVLPGSRLYFRQAIVIGLEQDPFSEPVTTLSLDGATSVHLSADETRQLRDHLSLIIGIADPDVLA